MGLLFTLLAVQGALGAFDVLYHHELGERLPWRPSARGELALHGVRNALYAMIFLGLAWAEWRGAPGRDRWSRAPCRSADRCWSPAVPASSAGAWSQAWSRPATRSPCSRATSAVRRTWQAR